MRAEGSQRIAVSKEDPSILPSGCQCKPEIYQNVKAYTQLLSAVAVVVHTEMKTVLTPKPAGRESVIRMTNKTTAKRWEEKKKNPKNQRSSAVRCVIQIVTNNETIQCHKQRNNPNEYWSFTRNKRNMQSVLFQLNSPVCVTLFALLHLHSSIFLSVCTPSSALYLDCSFLFLSLHSFICTPLSALLHLYCSYP